MDSEESEVLATSAVLNADLAADLWLEEVEMGEEDTDDEYDESSGTPESDPIAAFELAPAQLLAAQKSNHRLCNHYHILVVSCLVDFLISHQPLCFPLLYEISQN